MQSVINKVLMGRPQTLINLKMKLMVSEASSTFFERLQSSLKHESEAHGDLTENR